MGDWAVYINASGAPRGTGFAEEVLEALKPYGGAVNVGATRIGAQFTIQATSAIEAANVGLTILAGRFPALKPVEVRAQEWSEFKRELAEPTYPDIIGVTELAEALGVTKQRASELARSDHFPPPTWRLKSGPFWVRGNVEVYLKDWRRKPGRPPKEKLAAAG